METCRSIFALGLPTPAFVGGVLRKDAGTINQQMEGKPPPYVTLLFANNEFVA